MASVSSAFKKSAGVTDAKPNMEAGTALVTFDSGKTDAEKIMQEFKTNKAARFEVYKQGEKPKYNYDGREETLRGALAVKMPDAPGTVICRINGHRSGETAERWINVIASGELAAEIDKIRKSGVQRVAITGVCSEDGIKAAKIEAQ